MSQESNLDAFVVGAGAAGIYATYRLSRMGFKLKCIDIAGDVGGTWYWNRYPGAMSDTESYLYRFSWDKEDLQTYPWSRHYIYQPEILEYFRHVVERHDLRKYMQFNTEMLGATWEEDIQKWRIVCSTGEVVISRYLVNALGILARPNYPDIPGLSSFQGKLVHTAKWDEKVKLEGKRVGIIGNGSTGVQVMTAIAPIVKHLTSFQRRPQYSVPSGQGPIPEGYRDEINANYDQIWDTLWNSMVGFGIVESQRKTMDATPEERQRAFQEVWDKGNGFRFMFEAFGDLTINEEANEEACKFIRSKIDEIVKDPKKAKVLKPTQLYARRPLCDAGYYQIFNRDNVDVVGLNENPIKEIVPQGVKTSDGTIYELDVLILATGFDAIEGNYTRIKVVGRNGETMQDHWKDALTSYGAIACAGFPNMFMISGPRGPFANFPPIIELETNFIMSCIEYAERNTGVTGRSAIIEALPEAEHEWGELCEKLVEGSLFKKTHSWIFGVNVPGRKATTNFYFGGLKGYSDWVRSTIADGFRGFKLIESRDGTEQRQSKL